MHNFLFNVIKSVASVYEGKAMEKKKGLKYFKQKQIRRSCRSFSPTGKNDGVAGVYKT